MLIKTSIFTLITEIHFTCLTCGSQLGPVYNEDLLKSDSHVFSETDRLKRLEPRHPYSNSRTKEKGNMSILLTLSPGLSVDGFRGLARFGRPPTLTSR